MRRASPRSTAIWVRRCWPRPRSDRPPPHSAARSFSIRDTAGNLVFDSGNTLETEANARGVYDDGRSRDKGVEPEGVAIMKIEDRVYAIIGRERTTSSAIAVFDVTVPANAHFVDMIVTAGDKAPEGLAAFKHRGKNYLAISNETVAAGATVIPPFLTVFKSRGYAESASFCFGVIPPRAMFGRSWL